MLMVSPEPKKRRVLRLAGHMAILKKTRYSSAMCSVAQFRKRYVTYLYHLSKQ